MTEFEPIPTTPWTDVDSVRKYGNHVGDVDPVEVESVLPTVESLLHVSRHLVAVSDAARARLVGQEMHDGPTTRMVDDAFIDAQLASAGSKFNASITDPDRVLAWAVQLFARAIREGKTIPWIENLTTKQQTAGVCFTVTPEMKAELGLAPGEMLGTGSVIPVTPELAPRVSKERRGKGEARDQIVVNVINGMAPPETDQLIIAIKRPKSTGRIEFYSTYTGIDSANLPRPLEQNPDELAYNQAWWEAHAFVKP